MNQTSLAKELDKLTISGKLFEKLENDIVRCYACAHRCRLKPGQRGICQIRFNQAGELRVPWGYVAGAQSDPIEKKPFAHFLPGSDALTFGMLGCNFFCDFCQNWFSSQALRDPLSNSSLNYIQQVKPEQIIAAAHRAGAAIIASSYNEPLITSEWAVDIFSLAKEAGLKTVFVSNGFATAETLNYLAPYLDGYKIDLKSMQEKQYRRLGGELQPVLESIQLARELDLWVEAVTLVVPEMNDSSDELWQISRFLVSISADIPWHVTAFHPDYRLNDRERTTADTLQRAADIGQEAGLNYVYAGNLPGKVGSLEDTFCPVCQTRLIKRYSYILEEYNLTAQGKCPKCATKIAGVWSNSPESVRLGGFGLPSQAKFK